MRKARKDRKSKLLHDSIQKIIIPSNDWVQSGFSVTLCRRTWKCHPTVMFYCRHIPAKKKISGWNEVKQCTRAFDVSYQNIKYVKLWSRQFNYLTKWMRYSNQMKVCTARTNSSSTKQSDGKPEQTWSNAYHFCMITVTVSIKEYSFRYSEEAPNGITTVFRIAWCLISSFSNHFKETQHSGLCTSFKWSYFFSLKSVQTISDDEMKMFTVPLLAFAANHYWSMCSKTSDIDRQKFFQTCDSCNSSFQQTEVVWRHSQKNQENYKLF